MLSRAISIPPLQSYTFLPRTLQLKSIAKTIQQNVISARTLSSSSAKRLQDTYASFLAELKKLFRGRLSSNSCASSSIDSDVQEAVALMVCALEWPEEMRIVRDDLQKQILQEWIAEQPHRLWRFHPWLAAMLAAGSNPICALYIKRLFEHGFLVPQESGNLQLSDFAMRVTTLVLQSGDIEREVQVALQETDPFVLEKHFGVVSRKS